MVANTALRTGGRLCSTGATFEIFEKMAMAGTKLGSVATRQRAFAAGDRWRTGVEKVIDVIAIHATDVGCMNTDFGFGVDTGRNYVINEIRLDVATVFPERGPPLRIRWEGRRVTTRPKRTSASYPCIDCSHLFRPDFAHGQRGFVRR